MATLIQRKKKQHNKEVNVIWYDSFANEYCIPSEEDFGIAPPERYLRTVRCPLGDVYVEHWECNGSSLGDRIDVACPAYRYYDKKTGIWEERDRAEKRHHCVLQRILWWEIPPTLFDKYVKRFNLKGRKSEQS